MSLLQENPPFPRLPKFRKFTKNIQIYGHETGVEIPKIEYHYNVLSPLGPHCDYLCDPVSQQPFLHFSV